MTVDGAITDEYVTQEAEAGADVILTIDANFQEKIVLTRTERVL